MLRAKKLTIAVLLIVLNGMPGLSAGAKATLLPNLPTSNLQPLRVLSSTAAGVTIEVAVPWEQLVLEPVVADGKPYVRVALPGWSANAAAGAPSLPLLTETTGAPLGANVALRVTPGPAHRVQLSAPVLPAATLNAEWAPPAADGMAVLPEPGYAVEEDPAIYAGSAPYPAALAEVTSDGLLRQQRVTGIAAYPVQYHPQTRELTIYESLRIVVTFEGAPEATLRGTAAPDSAAYEALLGRELLNHAAAREWRQPVATPAAAPAEAAAAGESAAASIPWTPPNPGWRVKVREDGFYKLTYAELLAADLPVDALAPRTFKLYNMGAEVAIHEEGDGDSQFEDGEYLLFYGQAITSKYTTDNVYWLSYDPAGAAAGLRMGSRSGAPGDAESPVFYPARRHAEQNQYYSSLAPGDDNLERWFWDYVYPPNYPSRSFSFVLAAPYEAPATLRVAMLGFVDNEINPDHHVTISLNGTQVGEVWWDGIEWYILEMEIAPELLLAGANTLVVTCPNDTGVGADIVYVDWFELEFANTFTAEDNELAFTYDTAGAWKFQVAGFTSDQLAVYDVTDPAAPVRITDVAAPAAGSGYTAQFQDTVAAESETRYRAIADTAYRTVAGIEQDTSPLLLAPTNGADHIIIAHQAFATQAATLRDFRTSQGLRAVAVDVEEVYDEFGYGIAGAAPIHDFLAYAYANWEAPSYVVLIGDGHYDPKNYGGYGRTSFIPPYLANADPEIGETAADNRYVTISGTDNIPDMMLGRLAVTTADEASAFVSKISAYETSPATGDWSKQVLAVADNADSAGAFATLSRDLLACCLPESYQKTEVYYGDTHSTSAAARTDILAGINAGKLIVNYIGHGTASQWASEGLFKASDVAGLTNTDMYPVMLPMTCSDGYYIYPFASNASVAEVVTRAAGKGAVASWSPTGFGEASAHDYLNRGFFTALFGSPDLPIPLGQAITGGLLNLWATGGSRDLLDTYLLFGDPATQIGEPCEAPDAVNHVYITLVSSTQVQLDWDAAEGASQYQVWWKATDPYFAPNTNTPCTAVNGCTLTSETTVTHTGGPGNAVTNYTYLVRPVSACGAVQATPSHRTGEFDFTLVAGG